MLSDSQIERYSRQIILPQVGGKGQEKLLRARILVNGSGLLQSSALLYLAAAGVGTLGIIADTFESPLAALIAGSGETPFTGLNQLNSDCTLVIHARAELDTPQTLVSRYDLVLSSPDPLHEACYAAYKPFLCANVSLSQTWLFLCCGYEPLRPCLYCILAQLDAETETAAETCAPGLDLLATMFLGTLQATEAIKLILGLHSASQNEILLCRFPILDFQRRLVKKNSSCSWCGSTP